jgi:ABC-type polysaccharide/polyol phosphate export permease
LGASRALGALICVVTLVVAVLHIWFGYVTNSWSWATLSFALPVTVGLLAVCGIGFWLGWIMATTKEASPPPAETKEKTEEKKEEKKEK